MIAKEETPKEKTGGFDQLKMQNSYRVKQTNKQTNQIKRKPNFKYMQQRVQMSNNIYQELKFHHLWEVSMIYSSFPSQVFPFYSFLFLITLFSLFLVELSISTKLEIPEGSNHVYFAYSYILSTMLNTKTNTENIIYEMSG